MRSLNLVMDAARLVSESRFQLAAWTAPLLHPRITPPHTHAKEPPQWTSSNDCWRSSTGAGALRALPRARRADADDVIQETLIAAYRAFDSLRDPASFKPWLMSIARNKARDWFRNRARELALPLDALSERVLTDGRLGPGYATAVSDTLERLGGRDQQILYLYYFRNLPQADIARRLGIPPAPSRAACTPPGATSATRIRAPGWTRKELSIWINRQSNCPSCCPTTA